MKKLFTIGAIVLCGLIVGASFAYAQVPTQGLIGYYPFDGNADDASGNGWNGTVYGATLATVLER